MPAIDVNQIGRELGNAGQNRVWLPLLQHLGIDPARDSVERLFRDDAGEVSHYGVDLSDDAKKRLQGLTYDFQRLGQLDGRDQSMFNVYDQSGNPLTSYQVGGDDMSNFDTMFNLAMLATAAAGGYAAYGAAAGGAGAAAGTGATEAAALGNGAFLGEGVASGVGAWDAAAMNAGALGGSSAGSYDLINGAGDLYNTPASGAQPSFNASGGYNLIDGTGNMNSLYSTPSQGQFAGMNVSQLDMARAGLGAATQGGSGGKDQGLLGNLGQYGQYGRLLAGLLGGAAGGLGGDSGGGEPVEYGPAKQWTSPLQQGIYGTQKRVTGLRGLVE